MVLTRAQAAAQAAAHASTQAAAQAATQAGMQDLDPEEATALVEYSSARQASVAQFAAGSDELIAHLAQHFIAQTQALDAEQAMLYSQQQGQWDAQNAALMAVQASAEANVLHLTEQQRVIAQQLGEALTATHRAIQEKFQHLEVYENKKKGEIEHFVNEKIDQALQEVQRTSNETQLALVSQNGGARARFEEVEANISNNLEAIPARIYQVVEDQLAVLRGEMRPGEDINHLVQRMVEVSSTGAAESIKSALEAELRDARGEMQREIVSGVEGPMREYVRQLVLELKAQSESQLEARIQRALTNAQANVNSQNQRQADVTSIEAKICSDLKTIPARIHEVVDDKLAELRGEMRPNEDINCFVQRMVYETSSGAAESIKRSLEAELRDARDEIQREIVSDVEGPMRQYARQLVLELTAQKNSQLEARVQRALINTQADVNFQCQRQADATSISQEKLQRHISQIRSETIPVDETAIKALIQAVLRSEVDKKSKLEQETQCSENPTISGPDRVDFTAQINATIERSIQAAANTIGNAIKIGIRDLNAMKDRYRERQKLFDDAQVEDDEDEDKMSTEKFRLQQRIQDAWKRTYIDVRRGSTVLNAAGNVYWVRMPTVKTRKK
ncbi:hypothetical protein PF003_g15998 [Phytophthora fragariae]|nr:hypothetical protein PF003_g15998 [Phytophthora fragariae]